MTKTHSNYLSQPAVVRTTRRTMVSLAIPDMRLIVPIVLFFDISGEWGGPNLALDNAVVRHGNLMQMLVQANHDAGRFPFPGRTTISIQLIKLHYL